MTKYKEASTKEKLEKDVRAVITKLMSDESLSYDDLKVCIDEVISKFSITFKNKSTGSQWGKLHRGTYNAGKRETNEWWNTLKIILEKIPEYKKDNYQQLAEKLSNPLQRIKDPTARQFYQLLQKEVMQILRSENKKPLELLKGISDKHFANRNELLEFIVSNPTVLFSFIDKYYEAIKVGSSIVPLVSKVYHFNTVVETDLFKEATEDFDDYYNKENKANFSNVNSSPGLFLGHALSPHSDSICLLYELGRFKRVADIFGFKKPKIFLTAPSWAKYNRSAIEIHNDESQREKILKQCLAFRERLYGQLEIEVDKSEDTDIKSVGTKSVNHSKIKQSAKEFAAYSQHINQIKVDEKKDKTKQLLEIIENLCSPDNSDSYIDKLPPELKILAYSIVEDKKNLFVIHTILRHFNSLDENTFYYTLLQRYKQQHYNGWMKLAVESERKFDAAFIKLDKVDGYTTSNLGAVYYKHYYFKKGKDGSPLNVIPYTFPSGRVWRRAEGNIQNAIDNTILLWDFEDGRQDKIKSIVGEMDLKQLAIQMADLFSFCNYFFNAEFWEGKKDSKGEHQNGLNDLLNHLDSGCAKAWEQYRNKPDSLKIFCQYFLTMWYAEMELPYYFYPFMHIKKAESDKEFETTVRNVYSDIITYVLIQLNKTISCSEWK